MSRTFSAMLLSWRHAVTGPPSSLNLGTVTDSTPRDKKIDCSLCAVVESTVDFSCLRSVILRTYRCYRA